MNKVVFAVIGFVLLGLAQGQLNQTCIHTRLVTPHQFFETDKMVGTWYAIELYSGLTVDAKPLISKCIVDTMTRAGPNEITDVESYVEIGEGVTRTNTYSVKIDEEVEAIWLTESSEGPVDSVWLQTDYENWALQFGCSVRDNYRYETINIWSRERTIDPRTLEVLRVLATGYGYPRENGRLVDQTSC